MAGIALALLLHLVGLIARPLVLLYAIRGRYPAWLITPDDPESPFGQYEPTVRQVYRRFGRYLGDVYWLAWRNVAYGLRYKLKPAELLPRTDGLGELNYAHLRRAVVYGKRVDYFEAEGYPMWRVRLGPLIVLAGWKVESIVEDPFTHRAALNMEGRPVFTVRTTRTY